VVGRPDGAVRLPAHIPIVRCELSRRACRHFLSGFSVGIFVESAVVGRPDGAVRLPAWRSIPPTECNLLANVVVPFSVPLRVTLFANVRARTRSRAAFFCFSQRCMGVSHIFRAGAAGARHRRRGTERGRVLLHVTGGADSASDASDASEKRVSGASRQLAANEYLKQVLIPRP
jgi:hypothetical protein